MGAARSTPATSAPSEGWSEVICNSVMTCPPGPSDIVQRGNCSTRTGDGSIVLPWDEGERSEGGAGSPTDLEGRYHEQELVDARLGQLFQEEVLDDVNPVIGDEQHVH